MLPYHICSLCQQQVAAVLDGGLCGRCYDAQVVVPDLWPNQERAIAAWVEEAKRVPPEPVVVVGPTGSGKTRVMAEIAKLAREWKWPGVLFTNRRVLTAQAIVSLGSVGVDHGVMAAGYERQALSGFQVASMQTIDARALTSRKWVLPPARVVLIDEAHSNAAAVGQHIIRHYRAAGAVITGFTATPVGLGGLYSKIIPAGTKAECRAIGSLVPCKVFAPDEPDTKGVVRRKMVETPNGKTLWENIIFGDVFRHWQALNPQGRPTILWPPGVAESRWFVKEFLARGVTAEHIDGETSDEDRERIFKDSREGRCTVISSCGVLREGVDLPWITHGVLCQPCNGYSKYLQLVGRLMRAYPGKDHAVLIDHAAAYHLHGSPNEDREWQLGDDDREIFAERMRKFKSGEEQEPIRCPQCSGIRKQGPICPHCKFQHVRSVRMVRMTDGALVKQVGTKVKKKRQVSEDERVWYACLFACAKSRQPRTVKQAAWLFKTKRGHELPEGTLHYPKQPIDWHRYVTTVYPWLERKKHGTTHP